MAARLVPAMSALGYLSSFRNLFEPTSTEEAKLRLRCRVQW